MWPPGVANRTEPYATGRSLRKDCTTEQRPVKGTLLTARNRRGTQPLGHPTVGQKNVAGAVSRCAGRRQTIADLSNDQIRSGLRGLDQRSSNHREGVRREHNRTRLTTDDRGRHGREG